MTVVAGRYDLLTQVAVTSGGVLWHGHDDVLSRDVALKQSPLSAVAFVQRLRAEARTLAGLEHPNVVTVFGLVEDEGSAWLVEEWVPGVALPALLKQAERLRPQQALGVIRGALTGLAYTHQHRVVHGGVSPENILLDADGVSKLVDFGLASAADHTDLTPQLDVYGAGTVLATLLTGRAEPGDLTGVSGGVRQVLSRALASEPRDRYADAAAFLAALEDAARRDYGADWLAEAGVAALVAAAAAATAARLAGVGPSATGAGTPAGAAPSGQTDPVREPRTTGQPVRRGQLLRPRYLVVGATSVATVAVVLALVLAHSDGSPKARLDSQIGSSTPSPRTPAATATASSTPSLAATAPSGKYRLTSRVTASNIQVAGDRVGDRQTFTWTIAMTCGAQRCTGEAHSTSGRVFPLTFDGTTLLSTKRSNTKLQCVYTDGPNKGKAAPGVYVSSHEVDTFAFTALPNPGGGTVRQLRGTEHATATFAKLQGRCHLAPPTHVLEAMTLSSQD